mmetsp:Transcript_18737/g.58894  ORF Transcript_18737/g.58894 Transcript_18737/m.58894 type:complete len:826 (+) Transcript_18737:49-2526(+)
MHLKVHPWADDEIPTQLDTASDRRAETPIRPMTGDSNNSHQMRMEEAPPRAMSPMSTLRNTIMSKAATSAVKLHHFIHGEDTTWYWRHRSGFKPYDADSSAKIERAYQNGESKVRLKTGKNKVTPMEIFFEDMLQHDPISGNTREVKREGPDSFRMRVKRTAKGIMRWLETGRPRRELFAEYQKRREQLSSKMGTKEYSVTTLYWDSGLLPTIAKSNWFFTVSMAAVIANSIWIAYDADYNTAPSLSQAEWHFRVVEYIFCAFFSVELLIRFGAFKEKCHCLSDRWFVFDLMLLLVMMLELWVVPLCLEIFTTDGESDESSVLNQFYMLRMLRLLRLTRMARLLRLLPEMLTLLKGITAALSGVITTLTLLVILLFVFAIIFKAAVADGKEVSGVYFSGVVVSMRTLLMHGTLLDSPSVLLIKIYEEVGVLTALLWLVFIFISSFTVLNMLIGILCEVVSQVSQSEKEEAEVHFLKNNLLDILECYDSNNDQTIGEEEFDLLMQNIELHECLHRFGTDVSGIISLKDVLFEGKVMGIVSTAEGTKMERGARRELSFRDFMSVVLRLRGAHAARVTDIVELRDFVRQHFDRLESSMSRPGAPASRGCSQHNTPRATPRLQPLRVLVIGARGLRNADWLPGAGKSDVYCVCSIVGKSHATSTTATCDDTLTPVWNHDFELAHYQIGDSLKFDLMDSDVSCIKKDDHLGTALLPSSSFYPHGFDGELRLSDSGDGVQAYLKVHIPPARAGRMTTEQLLEMVVTRIGEVSAGQEQLRSEVRALREQLGMPWPGAAPGGPGAMGGPQRLVQELPITHPGSSCELLSAGPT